jgi:hypothetical protein
MISGIHHKMIITQRRKKNSCKIQGYGLTKRPKMKACLLLKEDVDLC